MKPKLSAAISSLLLFAAGVFTGRVLFPDSQEPARKAGIPTVKESSDITIPATKGLELSGSSSASSLDGLTDEEIKARALKVLSIPDRVTRLGAWMDVLAGMTEANSGIIAEALIERYQAGVDTVDEGRYQQFREGQVLGAGVMSILTKDPDGSVKPELYVKMKGWASAQPDAARQWIESLPPGKVQDSLRASWMEGLASANAPEATRQLNALPPEQQITLVDTLLSGLQSRGGLEGLRSWFDQNAGTEKTAVSEAAFARIVSRLGEKDRHWEAAAAFLTQHAASGFTTPSVLNVFTQRAAASEPGRCIDLIHAVSSASPALAAELDQVINRTVQHSISSETDTLGNWLNANRAHPLYDRTVQQFAGQIHKDNPEAAQRWIATIKDPAIRDRARAELGAP